MAWFATLEPARVGLVEIFVNPIGREWRRLVALSDPIDGLRGYLADGDLYCWGSLPLHRDVRADLAAALPGAAEPLIGVQINPTAGSVVVTDSRLNPDAAKAAVTASTPLKRLLGPKIAIRIVGSLDRARVESVLGVV